MPGGSPYLVQRLIATYILENLRGQGHALPKVYKYHGLTVPY